MLFQEAKEAAKAKEEEEARAAQTGASAQGARATSVPRPISPTGPFEIDNDMRRVSIADGGASGGGGAAAPATAAPAAPAVAVMGGEAAAAAAAAAGRPPRLPVCKNMHAWVLVMPGKRDIGDPFFVEPTTVGGWVLLGWARRLLCSRLSNK